MNPLQESYPCEQCDKVFGRKHHLKRHILTHTRPQLHLTCEQCGTPLTQQCYDRGHVGSKEFKCRFCPKSYTRRYGTVFLFIHRFNSDFPQTLGIGSWLI